MYFVRRNDQLQYSEQEEENMLSKVETKKIVHYYRKCCNVCESMNEKCTSHQISI